MNLRNHLAILLLCLTFVACSSDDEEPRVDPGKHVGNVIITTQQELDNFGNKNYHTVDGNLIISDNPTINDIVDLANLNSINTINGVLEIKSMSNILDVSGFGNLIRINGLMISDNWGILDLNSFSKIIECNGDISISNNSSLENYCGLTTLLKEGSFSGNFSTNNNLYNPSKEDIINGECNN